MTLTKKQRAKRANEPASKTRRREKQKEKKREARQAEEKVMAEYLTEKGWQNVGPLKDVWKTAGWDRAEDCCMSLRNAYRTQKKLEATGYVKPAGIDDDLGSLIMGD